jgi:hypothetical protein
MHVTIPWNFDHLLYVLENVFLFSAALARRTFRINHKKKLQPLPVDFDWSVESVQKYFGQPIYYSTLSFADMAEFEILWVFDLKWSFAGDALLLILWKWKVLGLSIWQDWQPYFNSGNNIGIGTLLNNWKHSSNLACFWKGVNVCCFAVLYWMLYLVQWFWLILEHDSILFTRTNGSLIACFC